MATLPTDIASTVGQPDIYQHEQWHDLLHAAAAFRYTPQQFGAYGDNSHDDTAAIQQMFTSLAATGGVAYFPKGTYLISSTIDGHGTAGSSALPVFILGAGRENICRLKATATLGANPTLNINPTTSAASPSWELRNIYFDNQLAPTSTSVYVDNVQRFRLDNVTLRSGAIGLNIERVSAGLFSNVDAYNQSTAGYQYFADTGTNSQGHVWMNCNYFMTAGATQNHNAGWLDLSGHQNQWYYTCSVIRTANIAYTLPYGFKLDGSATSTAAGQSWFTNCETDAVTDGNNPGDGSTGAGFWFNKITHVRLNSCWASSLDTAKSWRMPSMYFDQCTDVSIDNNYISGTGIRFGSTAATDIVAVRGNHFADPGTVGVDYRMGPMANVTNWVSSGNTTRLGTFDWFDNFPNAQAGQMPPGRTM